MQYSGRVNNKRNYIMKNAVCRKKTPPESEGFLKFPRKGLQGLLSDGIMEATNFDQKAGIT